MVWWAPEWIPTKGMTSWSPRTLFDDEGKELTMKVLMVLTSHDKLGDVYLELGMYAWGGILNQPSGTLAASAQGCRVT